MKPTAPNHNQRAMLQRRGLNPEDWLIVKVLNYMVVLQHRHTGRIKLLDKHNT